jgi:hypothetical protein
MKINRAIQVICIHGYIKGSISPGIPWARHFYRDIDDSVALHQFCWQLKLGPPLVQHITGHSNTTSSFNQDYSC